MSNIGEELLRIALDDLIKRQEEIDKSIDKSLTDKHIIRLINKQTHMLKSTSSLLRRIY
jgi:hypothetical protein